jgi:hypothetical protein
LLIFCLNYNFNLSNFHRAKDALRTLFPPALLDGTFTQLLKDDVPSKKLLAQLLIQIRSVDNAPQGGQVYVKN